MSNNQLIIGCINKLNKQNDIPALYSFLFLYETELKTSVGLFDIENKELKVFLQKNQIYLGALNKTDEKKSKKYEWHILYRQNINDKISKNDKVHHLLRHIRNSIANCTIKKERGNIFLLTDKKSNGENTMEGRIKVDLFYSLIENLIKTKKL